jgi:hypothetical protein
MTKPDVNMPDVTDEAIFQLLLQGEAKTLHEAEESYLEAAMPEILKLLGSPLDNAALSKHTLMQLVLAHRSRGWEDSIL